MQRHVLLEPGDVLGPVEQKQVAHPVQVDLLSELGREPLEGRQAAEAELDVDGVRELGPYSAGRLAGRPGPQLSLLDQDHVTHPGPTEVVGRAQPDHPAADDDDRGLIRELADHQSPHSMRRD